MAALCVVLVAPVAAETHPPAPARRGPVLAGLAPADDAREVVAIGPMGEVYAPDGHGGWVRELPVTTADRLGRVARAGGAVVAHGDGVVYRLAPNGWSALRLAQRGKAVMSSGARAVAAVGRQLYALDRRVGGEPAKLAVAPAPVLEIGAGKTIVVETERGLHRVDGAKVTAIKRVPRRVDRLISERWALTDRGALDLTTGTTTPWPAGLRVTVAAAGPGDRLIAVVRARGGLELATLTGKKLERDALPSEITGTPVGVVVDKTGRAAIALDDGRLAMRERGRWAVVRVREALPAAQPGPPPATAP